MNFSSYISPLLVDTKVLTLRPPVCKRSASSPSTASCYSSEPSSEIFMLVPQTERKLVAKLRSRTALFAYKGHSVSGMCVSATYGSSMASLIELELSMYFTTSSTALDEGSVADGMAMLERSNRVFKCAITGLGDNNRILFERVRADPHCIY